jgi:fucose 4-O-acetylase-like acetyltransferase
LTFNTNAFFFISGYLLFWKQLTPPRISAGFQQFISKNGGLRKSLGNIIFRMVIPSIIFAVLVFFPKHLLRGTEITTKEFVFDTIGGTTFWFTSALVVAEIVLLLLFTTRRKSIWFYVPFCFVFSVLGWYLATYDIDLIPGTHSFPWHYKQALISMCYIAAGGLYWRYETQIRKVLKKWILVVLTVGFVVVVLLWHDEMRFITSLCQINVLGYFVTLWATILLIELCRAIPEIKALSFIGQNTMGYYFLSGAVPNVMAIIALKLIPGLHWWVLLLLWVLNLLLATLFVIIINHWLPWLWDLRKLSKK